MADITGISPVADPRPSVNLQTMNLRTSEALWNSIFEVVKEGVMENVRSRATGSNISLDDDQLLRDLMDADRFLGLNYAVSEALRSKKAEITRIATAGIQASSSSSAR